MNKFISLLRGINVGGHNKIKMSDLKTLYESLGFSNVQTYIQSGNVIFESNNNDKVTLENGIKTEIKKVFNYDITVILRTSTELKNVVQNNPLADRYYDIKKLCVVFMKSQPNNSLVQELLDQFTGEEKFIFRGKEIYAYYPNGYGRSKADNNFYEKNLKVKSTARNWNSVNKIYYLANME